MIRWIILPLGMIICLFSCNNVPEPFDFTLKGTVPGMTEGKISFGMSPRVGDEIYVPVENGAFYYEGQAAEITRSYLFIEENNNHQAFSLIIEPGEIELELSIDSITKGTRVLQGQENKELQELFEVYYQYSHYYEISPDASAEELKLKEAYTDSLAIYLEENSDRMASLFFIGGSGNWMFGNERVGKMLDQIRDPKIKRSKHYKMAYSKWLSIRDSVHIVGSQAKDFTLPDSSGQDIRFSRFNKGNLTYVDWSGSWCGNSTNVSLELVPVYEKYHPMGFDIITVVHEFRYDRWISWLKKYNFPWTIVIELDNNNQNELIYSDYLFPDDKRYLVDESNTVIANDLNPGRLNEILMKHYEPEEYAKYLENKWDFPEGIIFMDKETPINSVEELLKDFKGKTVLLDFWATWCQPCIAEFKYYESLWPVLEENQVELVYLASDGYREEAQWMKYIRSHNLKGHHVRINSDLRQSLNKAGFSLYKYPTYMIVNKDGELVVADAARPGELENLKEQLLNFN